MTTFKTLFDLLRFPWGTLEARFPTPPTKKKRKKNHTREDISTQVSNQTWSIKKMTKETRETATLFFYQLTQALTTLSLECQRETTSVSWMEEREYPSRRSLSLSPFSLLFAHLVLLCGAKEKILRVEKSFCNSDETLHLPLYNFFFLPIYHNWLSKQWPIKQCLMEKMPVSFKGDHKYPCNCK